MVCMHQIMEFCGGNSENSTRGYLGIETSRVVVKIVNHLNQGIDAGVVFRPIAFKTRLGQARYYLFGPFGYLNQGCNSKIAKVTSIVSRVCARSGRLPSSTRINSSVCLSVRPSVRPSVRTGLQIRY